MSGGNAEAPQAQVAPEAEIDAVLAEFDGDARRAIGALLHDLAVLAADARASTSCGYMRGRVIRPRRPTQRVGGQ